MIAIIPILIYQVATSGPRRPADEHHVAARSGAAGRAAPGAPVAQSRAGGAGQAGWPVKMRHGRRCASLWMIPVVGLLINSFRTAATAAKVAAGGR